MNSSAAEKVAAFAVETLSNLSEATGAYLRLFEIATVFLFTVEYLIRIWVADRPTRFVFSFFGVIDLVAILPFYIATGLDLRSVRAVRLMRLFRLLKLARYSAAIRRFRIAFRLAREELVLFLCGSGILLYLSAFGIYYFEHDVQPEVFASVFDALWWAVATLTTVGYGDVYPVTAGGKLFTAGVPEDRRSLLDYLATAPPSGFRQCIRTFSIKGRAADHCS